MAFLKTKRSQFIAWMFIYAFGVMLMFSKGGSEGSGFLWGLVLGVGAGIATSTQGPPARLHRFLIVLRWLLGAWLFGILIPLGEGSSHQDDILERAHLAFFVTLMAGFPALLALLVWIFRRPKSEGAAAAAPSA